MEVSGLEGALRSRVMLGRRRYRGGPARLIKPGASVLRGNAHLPPAAKVKPCYPQTIASPASLPVAGG